MPVFFTHLPGDREKTWHPCLRFAQAKGRGQRFPLSSVNVSVGPHQAPIKQDHAHLASEGGFDPEVTGVEDMGYSLGVCDPQTVSLFRVSSVKALIGEE